LLEVGDGLETDLVDLLLCLLLGGGLGFGLLLFWIRFLLLLVLGLLLNWGFLVLRALLPCDVACLAFLLFRFFLVELLRLRAQLLFIATQLLLKTRRLTHLHMQPMPILTHLPTRLKPPLLTPLIIPLLHHIPPVIPLPLVVKQVLVLPLRLEVRVVDIKVAAVKIVLNARVGNRVLGGAD
jgi:hypothetical protein